MTGVPLQRVSAMLVKVSRVLGMFGSDVGALRVEVLGTAVGKSRRFVGIITADRVGQRIAAIPAAVAGASFWKGEAQGGGILPMHAWIEPSRYFAELERRGIHCHVEVR